MCVFKLKKIFFVLLFLCGSYSINAQNKIKPDIQGTVTNLTRPDPAAQTNELLGSILVECESNAAGEYDKADVKITKATRIYAQTDNAKRKRLEFDALKLNQRVEVRFAPEPALMTSPIQVGAAEIIILSSLAGSSQDWRKLPTDGASLSANFEMEKARRAINAINAVWVAAWAKGDAAIISGTFTADGKELIAGGKVYKGGKQIFILMRESMKKRGGRAKLTVATTDIWLDGNTAYETGTAIYEFTVAGEMKTLERRYFTVWKRQSRRGAWKIHSNAGVAK